MFFRKLQGINSEAVVLNGDSVDHGAGGGGKGGRAGAEKAKVPSYDTKPQTKTSVYCTEYCYDTVHLLLIRGKSDGQTKLFQVTYSEAVTLKIFWCS